MLDFLISIQQNIMMILSSMCAVIAVFVLFMKSLPSKRRTALLCVEICSMIAMVADYLAYVFRGNPSTAAFYVVRISNFLVFFFNIGVLYAFNSYLICLYENASKAAGIKRLKVVNYVGVAGAVMLILSQFNGLYYYQSHAADYCR